MPESPAASDPAEDARKLTVYFGERTRTPGGFLADELLDLFDRHRIATSVLLRGVEGFGLRHQERSDRSLSLSEDPPLVAVAVDTTERTERLLDDVRLMRLRGLVTVERARLLRGPAGSISSLGRLPEATKLTVYLGRQARVGRLPAYRAICELLYRRGVAGASVLLGVDGTAHGSRKRARFFDRNADVPVVITAVGPGDRIAAVLPELTTLVRASMLTVERVGICKRDGVVLEQPHALPSVAADGLALWQKITVYSSESALYQGVPIHRSLIRALRASGTSHGATALRGVWGFHGDHPPHGDRFLQVRRRVPVTTVTVDEPQRIADLLCLIDERTTERGLVTSELVPALMWAQPDARRGGFRLARHRY
jgi:PII-like signaling protein